MPTRSGRKVTQRQLAAKLGTSQQTVSNWETGIALPEPKILPLLAQVLDWDIHELYDLYAKAQSDVIESQGDLIDAQEQALHAERREFSRTIETVDRFVAQYEELGHTYRRLDDSMDRVITLLGEILGLLKQDREND